MKNAKLITEYMVISMNNKTRFALLSIIGTLWVLAVSLGISYGIWSLNHAQKDPNVINTACFDVVYTSLSEDINLANQYPKDDYKGEYSTPYSFKITNNCDSEMSYVIALDILSTSTIDLSKVKMSLHGNDDIEPVLISTLEDDSYTESGLSVRKILITKDVPQGEYIYNLRVWIDEDAGTETNNKLLNAKIVVTSSVKTGTTLHDAILANNTLLTTTPDFGKTPVIKSKYDQLDESNQMVIDGSTYHLKEYYETETDGLYQTEDEYGPSYYFRGTHELLNNNVIFGGFQWKIVRINGDGSIRLIYNGTEEQFNSNGTFNTTGDNTMISTTYFNNNGRANTYVGYMYGTPNSSSYGVEHGNLNSSTAKTYIDTWYETNLLPKGDNVTSKIADTIFCGDRNVANPSQYGFNTVVTDYSPFIRMSSNPPTPTLKCQNNTGLVDPKLDQYTVDGTGNGALTYPVGLISLDEMSMAGGITYAAFHEWIYSPDFYLYNNKDYYSMTSFMYYGSANSAFVGVIFSSGGLTGGWVSTASSAGLRPVINLSQSVLTNGGDGSSTNPYIVQ